MGIQDLHNLFNHEEPEERFYVVAVGRSGKHPGTNVYTISARSQREALLAGTKEYRRANQLGSNIALVNKVVYTGTEGGAELFKNRLLTLMEEEDNAT